MSRKRPKMSNCTHASTFGYRSRQCPRCKVLLRPTDFSEQGVCTWCQWELDEPVRRIAQAARKPSCETGKSTAVAMMVEDLVRL